MDDFRLDFSVRVYGEEATGDGQLEAALAAGAGIEVEDAFFRIAVGHMRVVVEKRSELRGSVIEVEGLEVVKHLSVASLDASAISVRLPVE